MVGAPPSDVHAEATVGVVVTGGKAGVLSVPLSLPPPQAIKLIIRSKKYLFNLNNLLPFQP